jgi:hypothetical protein
LTGVPLGNPDYGDADTIVRRATDPFNPCIVGGPSNGFASIEIVALSLRSIAPITVTVNAQPTQWDVAVDLSSVTPPAGFIFATKQHCNGGTFSSSLNVQPRFTFTKVGSPSTVRVLDTGVEGIPHFTLSGANQPWAFDVDPSSAENLDPCTSFHPGFFDQVPQSACDCNGNNVRDGCDISNGTSNDCNQNRRPDECDLASGSSVDSNHNGIPDECEPVSDVSAGGPARDMPTLAAVQGRSRITFAFSLPADGPVTLRVFNVSGQLVTTLVKEIRSQGAYSVEWNLRDARGHRVGSGVYVAKLAHGGKVVSTKAVALQ